MDSKKVAVLVSTYNGEKYIKEQIDSLLNQTYKNIDIIIRDDGSKDNTINIINEYSKNNKNIIIMKGNNVGFIKSFFELLRYSDNYDYYAFCDQDDIWNQDKIEKSVIGLSELDENYPNLFFSNIDYYDTDMNFIEHGNRKKYYNFRNSLVECVAQGMTMCINKKTRNMLIENTPQKCVSHDCWTYMLCAGLGNLVYNDESLVKYRRHKKSVTAEGKNFIQLQIWRIKKMIFGDMIKMIKKQIIEFDQIYGQNLKEEDKKLIKLFVNEKYNFINATRKTFYPKKFRRKIVDDFLIRIIFLFGIL